MDVSLPSELSSVYSKISYAALGTIGVYITDLSIIVTLVGVCVIYQITFSQLLIAVPWVHLSSIELTLLSAFVIYPLTCAKNV